MRSHWAEAGCPWGRWASALPPWPKLPPWRSAHWHLRAGLVPALVLEPLAEPSRGRGPHVVLEGAAQVQHGRLLSRSASVTGLAPCGWPGRCSRSPLVQGQPPGSGLQEALRVSAQRIQTGTSLQVQLEPARMPGAWKEAAQATFLLLDTCASVYTGVGAGGTRRAA